MNYNVDYFIAKFQAIPENQWTVRTHSDCNGRKCALGHTLTPHALAIYEREWKQHGFSTTMPMEEEWLALQDVLPGVATINNGDHPGFQQDTPKKRVLAALYSIKASQVEISDPPVTVEDILEREPVSSYA